MLKLCWYVFDKIFNKCAKWDFQWYKLFQNTCQSNKWGKLKSLIWISRWLFFPTRITDIFDMHTNYSWYIRRLIFRNEVCQFGIRFSVAFTSSFNEEVFGEWWWSHEKSLFRHMNYILHSIELICIPNSNSFGFTWIFTQFHTENSN